MCLLLVSVSVVRDWNEEFQRLRELPVSNLSSYSDKMSGLRKLISEFNEEAKKIGKIIISEMFLPTAKKSIKDINVGGIAGKQMKVEKVKSSEVHSSCTTICYSHN